MLIASNFLLWCVVLLQGVALLSLRRRLRMSGAPGPLARRFHADAPVRGGVGQGDGPAADQDRARTLLLYIDGNCSVAPRLIPDADVLARAEGAHLMLARDDAGVPPPPARRGGTSTRPARRRKASAATLPYAMIINDDGEVAAQGEAGTRADLVHLFARASQDMAKIALQN